VLPGAQQPSLSDRRELGQGSHAPDLAFREAGRDPRQPDLAFGIPTLPGDPPKMDPAQAGARARQRPVSAWPSLLMATQFFKARGEHRLHPAVDMGLVAAAQVRSESCGS
jgi:hypothetical protein